MIETLTINSLIMGTVASGYLFTGLKGFGFPEVGIDIKDRGNFHGARLGRFRYGRRVMSVELQIVGDSPSDYEAKRRALEQAISIFDGLKTLYIVTRSGLALQTDCILSAKMDDPYQQGKIIMSDVRLEFTAPYPYLLGQTEHTMPVAVYQGGGFAIPFGIPFDMSAGGVNLTDITNAGNGEAFPVVRIYGIIENPSLTNATTGDTFSILKTLSTVGDYIEVNPYYRTVVQNGVTNIKSYLSGDYWVLKAGLNQVKLTTSNAGSGARAEVVFRDSYLGI